MCFLHDAPSSAKTVGSPSKIRLVYLLTSNFKKKYGRRSSDARRGTILRDAVFLQTPWVCKLAAFLRHWPTCRRLIACVHPLSPASNYCRGKSPSIRGPKSVLARIAGNQEEPTHPIYTAKLIFKMLSLKSTESPFEPLAIGEGRSSSPSSRKRRLHFFTLQVRR